MPPIKPFFFDMTEAEIEEFTRESARVLRSGTLILGEYTERFERAFAEFIGVPHAVAVNSGSSALEFLLWIKNAAGRTVLVPTNTNFATVAAVVRAGGVVRYLDLEPETFAPSLALVRAALDGEPEVAGVLWVHIGGVIAPEFPEVVRVCRDRRLWVLEDAAHAHGSQLGGIKAGALADGGAFSFFPTKVMTTGEGGMITLADVDEAERARSLRNQGKRGLKFGGLHHDFGNSSRLTEIGAVLGLIQLRKLPQMLAARQAAQAAMTRVLDRGGIRYVATRHMDAASQYKLIVLLPAGRHADDVKQALAAAGVILGGGVYEIPCHRQPVFAGIGDGAALPNADRWCPNHICPPLTSGMTPAEAERVGELLVKHLS